MKLYRCTHTRSLFLTHSYLAEMVEAAGGMELLDLGSTVLVQGYLESNPSSSPWKYCFGGRGCWQDGFSTSIGLPPQPPTAHLRSLVGPAGLLAASSPTAASDQVSKRPTAIKCPLPSLLCRQSRLESGASRGNCMFWPYADVSAHAKA